jgi:hypothetical protein
MHARKKRTREQGEDVKDLKLFGTEVYPLHASGLRTLLDCPWRCVLDYLEEPEGEGGIAGDTGSATHVAVAEFHRGRDISACIEAMSADLARYPRADLVDAAGLFLKYASDIRNRVRVVLVEHRVAFTISPAPEDETQAPIQVVGTLDQVRDIDGRLSLWDLKTSKRDPMELLGLYTFQIAAYCIGASLFLERPVHPGGIILPRKYTKDTSSSPAHWHYPWKLEDIEHILRGVRHTVARIRAGDLWHKPSADCMWCSQKSPDFCLPKLITLGKK